MNNFLKLFVRVKSFDGAWIINELRISSCGHFLLFRRISFDFDFDFDFDFFDS